MDMAESQSLLSSGTNPLLDEEDAAVLEELAELDELPVEPPEPVV